MSYTISLRYENRTEDTRTALGAEVILATEKEATGYATYCLNRVPLALEVVAISAGDKIPNCKFEHGALVWLHTLGV